MEAVFALLEMGVAVGAADGQGGTALHLAARRGQVEVLLVLQELGVTLDVRDRKGATAIHEAAAGRQVEALQVKATPRGAGHYYGPRQTWTLITCLV